MAKIVFNGHGGFETSTNPPWVTVPEGSRISFYTDNLKGLLNTHGVEMENMTEVFEKASPSQVVEGGQRCVNYTLYPTTDWIPAASTDDVQQVVVDAPRTLDSLLKQYTGDMYWGACRIVQLDAVGGKFLGVNEMQLGLGGDDSSTEMTLSNPGWAAWFMSLDESSRVDEWNKLTPEEQNGASLVDENVRQWKVRQTDAGSGVLNSSEMDGFLDWWGSASESERNESWGDLNEDQRDQIRQRYADTAPD